MLWMGLFHQFSVIELRNFFFFHSIYNLQYATKTWLLTDCMCTVFYVSCTTSIEQLWELIWLFVFLTQDRGSNCCHFWLNYGEPPFFKIHNLNYNMSLLLACCMLMHKMYVGYKCYYLYCQNIDVMTESQSIRYSKTSI